MYYIIETNHVDPGQSQARYRDADRIDISTSPAIYNGSGEECIHGWAGTTDGWAVYAHGAYATLDAARAAIAAKFGAVREVDDDEYHSYRTPDIVETYEIVTPRRVRPVTGALDARQRTQSTRR
jgi:hypothetical protein